MTELGSIRALLIEGDSSSAILTRDLLDGASDGLVDLVHVDQLAAAIERLGSEAFDVVLFRALALEQSDGERIDRLLVQAPGVPVIVLALLPEADLALPMIRYGAQDFWVAGRDTADTLLRAMRYAIERKPRLQRLAHQANYDLLTDLPNRYLFEDRLAHAAARAKRQNSPLAVLYLDMDGFKAVNDGLGHLAGDHVLRLVAKRLTGVARESDTVARVGGDEFAVVLESLAHVEDAAVVAQKILAALAEPFIEENRRFDLTCSIGISFFLLDGTDARSLLDHADRAMYRAKQLGGNRYSQCMEDLGPPAQDRFHLVSALQAALARQEFRLHFQPQVDRVSGAVKSVEALLRWQQPEHGLIGPASFIAVAEDCMLIDPLDAWVLRHASAQLKRWQDAGLPALSMAINLSARQLLKPGLAALVAMVLEDVGLRPTQLQLEFKEAALLQDYAASAATLAELKGIGIQVALDDFGNGGASAISHLRRLPIDVIKLDRALIQETGHPGTERIVAQALTELAHSLAIKVVAEGVETRAQWSFLHEVGCDTLQGYLISPPLDGDAMTAWLGRAPPVFPGGAGPTAAPRRRRPRSAGRRRVVRA
jgi:diguanylate cyclase (GGDEF)-like protein